MRITGDQTMTRRCPYCQQFTTLHLASDIGIAVVDSPREHAGGFWSARSTILVCPNPLCNQATLALVVRAMPTLGVMDHKTTEIFKRVLIPSSTAKRYGDCVPVPIREDYQEACDIALLSPKASATLSRRCLQGMLRDFWKVKPGRPLIDEIEQVRDRIDPALWDAIDTLRKRGNIGAHMEADINVIVEVDPGEAELLTSLIETCIEEWYVARAERNDRIEKVRALSASKPAADPGDEVAR